MINADKNSPRVHTLHFHNYPQIVSGKKCLLRSFLVAGVANLEGGRKRNQLGIKKCPS